MSENKCEKTDANRCDFISSWFLLAVQNNHDLNSAAEIRFDCMHTINVDILYTVRATHTHTHTGAV